MSSVGDSFAWPFHTARLRAHHTPHGSPLALAYPHAGRLVGISAAVFAPTRHPGQDDGLAVATTTLLVRPTHERISARGQPAIVVVSAAPRAQIMGAVSST
jgi:hypothetical protein